MYTDILVLKSQSSGPFTQKESALDCARVFLVSFVEAAVCSERESLSPLLGLYSGVSQSFARTPRWSLSLESLSPLLGLHVGVSHWSLSVLC
jgi:hypothetical protein